jgi:hypothetical protein
MVKLSRPRPQLHDLTAERLGKPCFCPACSKKSGSQQPQPATTNAGVVTIQRELEKQQAPPAVSLSQRLTERFGVGQDDSRRRALYIRLELLVERLGWRVEVLVQEAAMMAEGRRDEGRYFARSIVLKLRESGVYTWQS